MAPSLEQLFFECLQQGTPGERAAYLERACAGDPALLRRLGKMLEAHESTFLEHAAHVAVAPEAAAAPANPERVGQRIGAYRLVEPLGEGGMGTVWRAEQLEPVRREVALKLIKAGMDTRQVVARFEAERQALALMDHPHIARVLDGGADAAGRPYFVMDLCAGVPITRHCDEQRLPVRQRLALFAQIADAIQHAHQKGVIHRDIKPSNVLVTLQDGRAVPKVIDFGIAKAIDAGLGERTALTQQGGLLGTLEYMSPEQSARSAAGIDTRSDIYSLGVLLYELLTGSTPLSRRLLEQSSLAEVLRGIADDETPKPSTRLREPGAATAEIAAQRGVERRHLAKLVRGELDWIVMKALEKDRDRRYATAADLAQDVRRFLAHEPVLAGPPSALYRLRKFARRRRGALVAASALVAALLVAIGGVGWALRDRGAREAEAARVAAERGARVLATVEELLAEAQRQMAAQAWPAALATARRADAAATSGEAEAATAQRVRVLLADLEFVERLDRIRAEQSLWVVGGFDSAGSVERYTRAFREHGVDLAQDPLAAIVARLQTTPALALPLAAGLDDLARRTLEATRVSADCQRIVRVANALDPEPVRCGIRSAGAVLDTATLLGLAATIDVRAQPPATIVNLAWALGPAQPEAALRLLRAAQHAHPGDFWLAFELGGDLLGQDEHRAALPYLVAAVALRPDSAAAHTNLGNVLRNCGEPEAALASARRAIELDPTLSVPHTNACRALIDLNQPDAALESARAAVALDPGSGLAWLGVGSALLTLQQLEPAGDAFRRAIELEPQNVHAHGGLSNVLRGQQRLPEALAVARHAVALGPADAEGYVSLGNALGELGDNAASAEAFRKAIELQPGNAVAHGNLGTALLSTREPARVAEALALCRQAVALDPRYAIGHLVLGNALSHDGQDEAALACYGRAAALDPRLHLARFNAGQLLWKHGRGDEALVEYQATVALRPDFVDAWLGIARVHSARKEPQQAEAALRRILEHDHANASAQHSLAVALSQQGRHDEALAAKRRAAELEPAVALRQLAVATSLFEMRRYDEVTVACRKALEVDPRCRDAHALLGVALRLQDKLDEAIEPLGEALRLGPPDAQLADVLAMLLATCPDERRRDAPRALELARQALELEPGVSSHQRTLGVALLRAGRDQAALAALQLASEQDPRYSDFDAFFAAMAQHRLGDAAAARAAFERGAEQLDRTGSGDPDTLRARAEAARLLGIELAPR